MMIRFFIQSDYSKNETAKLSLIHKVQHSSMPSSAGRIITSSGNQENQVEISWKYLYKFVDNWNIYINN